MKVQVLSAALNQALPIRWRFFVFGRRGKDLKRRDVRDYLERRGTGCAERPAGGPKGGNTMLPTGGQVLSAASFLFVLVQRFMRLSRTFTFANIGRNSSSVSNFLDVFLAGWLLPWKCALGNLQLADATS